MSNISPYGAFTGRRLYSSSKIDNEIEEILHRFSKLEPYERMPTNPNLSPWVSQRMGHNYRAEWLREAKEWEEGLVGTEDDKKLKQRILDRILRVEKGNVRAPGHLAIIPSWKKIGGRTFKRYFGIDFIGGKHMVMMPDSLRNAMTGGLTNATNTSGFQETINHLATQGAGPYANGGVLDIFPGAYTSTGVWQLPTTDFDFTMQGGGKSNTLIYIAPSTTQTAAIAEGYTSWVSGIFGPRFVARDLGISVSGTYSGTSAPADDYSGGGVVSLQFYSVFFEHVSLSINTTHLTALTNLLKCGTFAGPSQPCFWYDFDVMGYANDTNIVSTVCVWFEGFSWKVGVLEGYYPGYKGEGLNIRSNGPNYVGQIDSYDNSGPNNPVANNWMNFIGGGGVTTLDSIEYPFLGSIVNDVNGGTVNGKYLTIIGILNESAVNQGVASQFSIWNEGARYIKTIGFSMGLQNGNQWVPTYLTGPFDNSVSGEGYFVGLNCYNGAKTPTASETYTASTDLLVNSTGGTGVNITIYDQFGNAILTGLTSLSAFRMSIGMQINFGAFTASPTVSIYQVSG
jgi:hypothetical protein